MVVSALVLMDEPHWSERQCSTRSHCTAHL